MTSADERRLRAIIADEVRKALAEIRMSPSVGETVIGTGAKGATGCQDKELNVFTDPTSTATDGASYSSEQTALNRWSRIRLLPKPIKKLRTPGEPPAVGR